MRGGSMNEALTLALMGFALGAFCIIFFRSKP